MRSRQLRRLNRSCFGAWLGIFGASGCFEDPATSLTDNNEEETGDGDGDGDGDGEPGDGDGEPGDGDGDGDGECGPDEVPCNGICVNIDVDASNCGMCGNVCPAFQLCGEGMCKPEKYVFATNTTVQGNLGVLALDAICGGAAVGAMLPNGLYRAWVSTPNESPSAWGLDDAVWRLRGDDDVVVAYSNIQLFSGELAAPINRNEFGEPLPSNWNCNNTVELPIWTATSAAGMPDGPDCMGWSSNAIPDNGAVGNASATDESWSTGGGCTMSCSTALPIYCFQN